MLDIAHRKNQLLVESALKGHSMSPYNWKRFAAAGQRTHEQGFKSVYTSLHLF